MKSNAGKISQIVLWVCLLMTLNECGGLLHRSNRSNTTTTKRAVEDGGLKNNYSSSLLKETIKTHFLHKNSNVTSANKTDGLRYTITANSSSEMPEKTSTNTSSVPISSQNATSNGTKVQVSSIKPGLFKLRNSTNKGSVRTNYSDELPHQILKPAVAKLKDYNSNERHPEVKQTSETPRIISNVPGVKDPKAGHALNEGIRISIDSSEGKTRPQKIGVTTYNLGSTSLSLTDLERFKTKQDSPNVNIQNNDTGTSLSDIGITIGQSYKDHRQGVSENMTSTDHSKNRENLVLKPLVGGFIFKNQKSGNKQLSKFNLQFQDSSGFVSNLPARRPSSKVGIVIRDNGNRGNQDVKCSIDGEGSATICISGDTDASKLLNSRASQETLDNFQSHLKIPGDVSKRRRVAFVHRESFHKKVP